MIYGETYTGEYDTCRRTIELIQNEVLLRRGFYHDAAHYNENFTRGSAAWSELSQNFKWFELIIYLALATIEQKLFFNYSETNLTFSTLLHGLILKIVFEPLASFLPLISPPWLLVIDYTLWLFSTISQDNEPDIPE